MDPAAKISLGFLCSLLFYKTKKGFLLLDCSKNIRKISNNLTIKPNPVKRMGNHLHRYLSTLKVNKAQQETHKIIKIKKCNIICANPHLLKSKVSENKHLPLGKWTTWCHQATWSIMSLWIISVAESYQNSFKRLKTSIRRTRSTRMAPWEKWECRRL
jgi:hypothetical protein